MQQLCALFICAATLVLAAPPSYHVAGSIPVGRPGGWDYLAVDPQSHRLYVSHASEVIVIDLETKKTAGIIPNTLGVHGIALAPGLKRGFISNGQTNDVSVFDLGTLKETGRVATGRNPDAIFFDAKGGQVFTFNGRSKDATVFDAASLKGLATIPLGGKPEFFASDGAGRLWVNIEDTHEIVELDTARHAVTKRYTLAGCEEPSGLALDAAQRRLFSVCGNGVMVVSDPQAGKVIASVPIGSGSDGAGFDAASGLAFSSNGEGTLTIVRQAGARYEVAATLKTTPSARTMTIDPVTHRIYLPAADFPAGANLEARPRPVALPDSFRVLVVEP